MGETQIAVTGGALAIAEVRAGDRVVAQAGEPPEAVEVVSTCGERAREVTRTVGESEVLAYVERSGQWALRSRRTLTEGDAWIEGGRLVGWTSSGVEDRGLASPESLAEADAVWSGDVAQEPPCAADRVLLVESGEHAVLGDVPAGTTVSWQGALMVVRPGWLEPTGEVLARVVSTSRRVASEVLDVEVAYSDGTTGWLGSTAEHPFYVPERGKYVPLRQVDAGSVLHARGGGTAVLVSKTWRQARVPVYNFEVAGEHNYFAAGATGGGLLTHNTNTPCGIPRNSPRDWCKLMKLWDEGGYGDILSDANRLLIRNRRVPIVDQAWVNFFPGDYGMMGDKITMHHVKGLSLVIPLPRCRHGDAHMPGGTSRNYGGPGSSG